MQEPISLLKAILMLLAAVAWSSRHTCHRGGGDPKTQSLPSQALTLGLGSLLWLGRALLEVLAQLVARLDLQEQPKRRFQRPTPLHTSTDAASEPLALASSAATGCCALPSLQKAIQSPHRERPGQSRATQAGKSAFREHTIRLRSLPAPQPSLPETGLCNACRAAMAGQNGLYHPQLRNNGAMHADGCRFAAPGPLWLGWVNARRIIPDYCVPRVSPAPCRPPGAT